MQFILSKIQNTIDNKIFLDDHGKNCRLNFGNDKNQVTFFYVAASGPLHLALFFYSLNWTKIVQIFYHIYLFTMFLLLDE